MSHFAGVTRQKSQESKSPIFKTRLTISPSHQPTLHDSKWSLRMTNIYAAMLFIHGRRRGGAGAANGATRMRMEPHVNTLYMKGVQALRHSPQLFTLLKISQTHGTCVSFFIRNISFTSLEVLVCWDNVCH